MSNNGVSPVSGLPGPQLLFHRSSPLLRTTFLGVHREIDHFKFGSFGLCPPVRLLGIQYTAGGTEAAAPGWHFGWLWPEMKDPMAAVMQQAFWLEVIQACASLKLSL